MLMKTVVNESSNEAELVLIVNMFKAGKPYKLLHQLTGVSLCLLLIL